LDELVKAGKIRAIGVSNETSWGVSEFIHQAEKQNAPRIASIQNAYHLMNRAFEQGWMKPASAKMSACSPTARWHSAN
jgi:aryl-alcohol dehydrogenase-like predicted oxidoreductase